MAKNRQIETDLFNQGWFYELPNESKLLFFYAYLNANNGGIVDLIKRRVENDIQIDFESAFNGIISEFEHISGTKYLMNRILKTQFPNGLSEDHPFHKSVYKILVNEGVNTETFSLNKGLPKPYESLGEALPKVHSHSNSNSQGNSQGQSQSNSLPKIEKISSELNANLPNPDKSKNAQKETYEQWVSQGADGKTEYAPYVWLTKDEYYKILERYGGNQELLNEMIDSLSEYKSRENPKKPTKFNYQIHFKSSYQILHHGWMYDRYLERLTIMNKAKTSEIIANKVQNQTPLNTNSLPHTGGVVPAQSALPMQTPIGNKELIGMYASSGSSIYNHTEMIPRPDYIVDDISGERVYLSWDVTFMIPGISGRKYPITTYPSKLRKLPENLLQAYCLFFSLTIEDINRL
jgi:hypothetical protein